MAALARRLGADEAAAAAAALVAAMGNKGLDTRARPGELDKALHAVVAQMDPSRTSALINSLATAHGNERPNPGALSALVSGLQAVDAGKATNVFVAAIHGTSDSELLSALVRGPPQFVHLEPADAAKVANALVADLRKPADDNRLIALADGLKAVGSRLEAAEAGRAAEALAGELRKTSNPQVVIALAGGLEAVARRPDAVEARRAAEAALFLALASTSDPTKLAALAQALGSVVQHPQTGRSVARMGQVTEILATAIGSTSDSDWVRLFSLAQGLVAIAKHLKGADAARAADAFVLALYKMNGSDDLTTSPPEQMANLLRNLDAPKAAEALITSIGKSSNPNVIASLAPTLGTVGARLGSAERANAAQALIGFINKTSDQQTVSALAGCLSSLVFPPPLKGLLETPRPTV